MSSKSKPEDFILPTETVTLQNGSKFFVRGLGLQDILVLFMSYGPEMKALFDKYAGSEITDLASDAAREIGSTLAIGAPKLLAEVIGISTDDAEMAKIANKLPLSAQVEAMEKIARLTFDAEGGPKKLIETVIEMLAGANNLFADLTQSKIG